MNELKRMNWNEWIDMNDLWTSSWKSGPNPSVFDDFSVISYLMTMWSADETELSLQSRAHFVDLIIDLIFKKCQKKIGLRILCEIKLSLSLSTVSCTFCRPHLQKVEKLSFSRFMWSTTWWRCGRQMKWSTGYSRAHSLVPILSTSSSKNWKNWVFDNFYVINYFDDFMHILSASPAKSGNKNAFFFTISMWNPALATVSCAFCRPLSGSRRAPAETETLQRRPRTAILPGKTQGLRPRVFSAVNSRVPDRLHFPTTSWRCDWNDDVVGMMIEMMMWLPWWWDS